MDLTVTIERRASRFPRANGGPIIPDAYDWRVRLTLGGGPLYVPATHRDSLYSIHGRTRADAVAALIRWVHGCAEALRAGIAACDAELVSIERRMVEIEARIAAGHEDEDDRSILDYIRRTVGEDCAAGGGVLGERAGYRRTLSAIEASTLTCI